MALKDELEWLDQVDGWSVLSTGSWRRNVILFLTD
jgi:hypothetical protein